MDRMSRLELAMDFAIRYCNVHQNEDLIFTAAKILKFLVETKVVEEKSETKYKVVTE